MAKQIKRKYNARERVCVYVCTQFKMCFLIVPRVLSHFGIRIVAVLNYSFLTFYSRRWQLSSITDRNCNSRTNGRGAIFFQHINDVIVRRMQSTTPLLQTHIGDENNLKSMLAWNFSEHVAVNAKISTQ